MLLKVEQEGGIVLIGSGGIRIGSRGRLGINRLGIIHKGIMGEGEKEEHEGDQKGDLEDAGEVHFSDIRILAFGSKADELLRTR